jgi:hypothetical protein
MELCCPECEAVISVDVDGIPPFYTFAEEVTKMQRITTAEVLKQSHRLGIMVARLCLGLEIGAAKEPEMLTVLARRIYRVQISPTSYAVQITPVDH